MASIAPEKLATDAPRMDYELTFESAGEFPVQVNLIPTQPIQAGRGLRFGIALNDEAPREIVVNVRDGSAEWAQNVLNATVTGAAKINVPSGGKHTLHIYAVDAGVVLDKITIDCGDLQPSYLGPKPRGLDQLRGPMATTATRSARVDSVFAAAERKPPRPQRWRISDPIGHRAGFVVTVPGAIGIESATKSGDFPATLTIHHLPRDRAAGGQAGGGRRAAPRARAWWMRRSVGRAALLGLLLWPVVVHALDPRLTVFQYNCQNWSRRNGLPVSGVKAIAQTRDGYLWLGSQQGLVRFDGISFTSFPVSRDPMLVSQNIYTLAPARDGGLWFGLREGAVGHFDGAHFAALRAPWVKPNMKVFAVKEARDGALWVGWETGFARWSPDGAPAPEAEQTQTSPFHALYEDSKGRIWLGAADGGDLFYWEAGKRHRFPDESLRTLYFHSLAEDHDGNIWIGTNSGVHCYDANFRRKELPPLESSVRINAILVDRQGVVWIGTIEGGLVRYHDGRFTRFGAAHGLLDNNVLALWEDAEGSLWIGTQTGLTQLSDVKFPTYGGTEGLIGEPLGVASSRAGGLWVTTVRGLTYLDGEKTRSYGAEVGWPNPWLKRAWEAADGDLYLLDGNRNVLVMSEGRIIARHPSPEWQGAMCEDDEGVIVSFGEEIARVSRAGITPFDYQHNGGKKLGWIINLSRGREGALWVASEHGVWRIRNGERRRWATAEGLTSDLANCVFEDTDGAVWAGLVSGLARIKNDTVRCIGPADGLFANLIHTIAADDFGWFWIDSNQGLFRVRRQELNDFADGKLARIQCEAFTGPHALKGNEKGRQEYTVARTSDGRLWFPAVQGLIAVDPAHVPMNRVAPSVYIESALINGQELKGAAPARLAAGRGELEFRYTALSFVAPQEIRFRYQLEGYDQGWVAADRRRAAFYTNLAAGKYVFRVQACNADGVWSPQGDALAFELPPHFYEALWFRILASIAIAAAVVGLVGLRVRQLKHRQAELARINTELDARVRERTAELSRSHAETEQREHLFRLIF
ncbi:MAG TPA: two-component regulator propeller domain-containing protein, partial [Opitutaceae bacterium]|nr:two-component regulator propeller domain-containing protein [Opitutaceae bacterium]